MGTFGVVDNAGGEAAQEERRELHRGFGASLSRAFEIALVPVLLGGMGFALDRWLGTRVAFTIALSIFGVAGTSVKLYYGYRLDMERLEADAPWRRQPRETAP